MRVLVIAANLPTPDRASGDLRFFSLLHALAAEHRVSFSAFGAAGQAVRLGGGVYRGYVDKLEAAGITLVNNDPVGAAQEQSYDLVLFEFYFAAAQYMDEMRLRLPSARMVIDTVDVHFNRLLAKARLTGLAADARSARQVRGEELAAYGRADALIVVSDAECALLRQHGVATPQYVIPNFHALAPLIGSKRVGQAPELVFVGGFAHEPNVDAVLYFVRETWPRVLAGLPQAHLTIVGGNAPAEVCSLASDAVSVTGYVADLAPVFQRAHISIAPLRYGGGVKGKVGEAMAEGLPVVTTSVGIEGMAVADAQEVLVADDAEQFASAILRLARDPGLYERLRTAAWSYIDRTMSAERVRVRTLAIVQEMGRLTVRRASARTRARRALRDWFSRNLTWRLRRS